MPGHASMSTINPKKTITLQIKVDPKVRSAARIRAEQRHLSLGGHISDLVKTDAAAHEVWALLNREEACGD